MAFSVKNLDKSYKILSKKGVVFNAPPQLSPDGFAKVTSAKVLKIFLLS